MTGDEWSLIGIFHLGGISLLAWWLFLENRWWPTVGVYIAAVVVALFLMARVA